MIHFTILGVFLGIMFDLITQTIKHLPKIINVIIEIIFWIVVIYASYKYVYNASKGYIPIYIFLFHILGLVLYFCFLSKSFIKNLTIIHKKINKIWIKLRKTVIIIVIPKEIIKFFKKVLRRKKDEKSPIPTDNNDDVISSL